MRAEARRWRRAFAVLSALAAIAGAGGATSAASEARRAEDGAPLVRLMTLDPGHFHAALVQKAMYPGVDRNVHVYAPEGQELRDHLARIEAYNSRADDPTSWIEIVSTGDDSLERMLAERPGNVVVLSGNNARKAESIRRLIDAGLHVLADKPMVIRPEELPILERALRVADEKGVLLFDIMTERHEITSILQRRLAQVPAVFGGLVPGTPDDPAITKESVHHFAKLVSGRPLRRPAWFFDVRQQGEALVDVGTHLVDLVQWQAFPDEALDYRRDIEVLAARRWPTVLTLDQLAEVTGLAAYPEALRPDVSGDGRLMVYANGEATFTLRGIHARVSVEWRFRAPEGGGDTHFSVMRGSTARLIVRQGREEGYVPTLYVEPAHAGARAALGPALRAAVAILAREYQGLALSPTADGWRIEIPEALRVGHEAHFAQVTQQFFRYLEAGRVPAIEVQRMLAKSYVTTRALALSRGD